MNFLNRTSLLKNAFVIFVMSALSGCVHQNMKNAEVHDKALHIREIEPFAKVHEGQKLTIKGCLYSDFGRLGEANFEPEKHVYLENRMSWSRADIENFLEENNIEQLNPRNGYVGPILVKPKKSSKFGIKKSRKSVSLKGKKITSDNGLYVVLEGVFEKKTTPLFYPGIGDDRYFSILSDASIVYFDNRECRGWYDSETGELLSAFSEIIRPQ